MTDLNLEALRKTAENAQPFVYHGGVDPARVSIPAEQALALIARIEIAEHRVARYRALAEARQTTIQRVRELHKSEDNGTKGHYTNEPILECADCVDGQGYPLEYPCPTIKALGEPK